MYKSALDLEEDFDDLERPRLVLVTLLLSYHHHAYHYDRYPAPHTTRIPIHPAFTSPRPSAPAHKYQRLCALAPPPLAADPKTPPGAFTRACRQNNHRALRLAKTAPRKSGCTCEGTNALGPPTLR
ncbi:hypothetical protein MKEN_00198100 [Mycena kentingensis (nom. inval.)]|nr:hypothetical protein MKEN_00198100 [Mycena kentingensis (nom. inval.)]